ncbi:MAG: hypothetical protein NWE98_01980 [Candidatus Bathyarchaeota archaeon]|nr:hypothetical protein [Candidatus Bathyarchaeota archaeon]
MQNIIQKSELEEETKTALQDWLKQAKFVNVNGTVLLTEETINKLCLLLQRIEDKNRERCSDCERIDPKEAYSFVCQNPPERW